MFGVWTWGVWVNDMAPQRCVSLANRTTFGWSRGASGAGAHAASSGIIRKWRRPQAIIGEHCRTRRQPTSRFLE